MVITISLYQQNHNKFIMINKIILAVIMKCIVLTIPTILPAQEIEKIASVKMIPIEKQFQLDLNRSVELKKIMLQHQDSTAAIIADKKLRSEEKHLALIRLREESDKKLMVLLSPAEKDKFLILMQAGLWEIRKNSRQRVESKKKLEWEETKSRKINNKNYSKLEKNEKSDL